MQFEVDGKTVFAATGGKPFDPAQPAILFIHGAAMDHTAWVLQTRYFAWHGSSVAAVDLPGHGRSEGPPLAHIEAMADWTVAALDALGARDAALAGHSMGALVALDAAARYPDKVRALALLGASVPMTVTDALLNAAEANDHLAMDMVNAWGHGHRAHLGGHRMPGLWLMRGGLRLLESAANGVLYTDMSAANTYSGGEAAATAVACPTLVVCGARDLMTPAKAGRGLAEKIPGAETVILPGIGHMMMEEAPDETLDALRQVL